MHMVCDVSICLIFEVYCLSYKLSSDLIDISLKYDIKY